MVSHDYIGARVYGLAGEFSLALIYSLSEFLAPVTRDDEVIAFLPDSTKKFLMSGDSDDIKNKIKSSSSRH